MVTQTKVENEAISAEIRDIQLELKRNETYDEWKKQQSRLQNALKDNETLRANDSSRMRDEIKGLVMESIKKYHIELILGKWRKSMF